MNLSNIQSTISSKETRQQLIESGIESAKKYLLNQPLEKVDKVDKVELDDSVQELG